MENIDNKKNNFSDRPKNRRILIPVLIITILLSSAFGAVFGFMAGSVGQKITGNKYLGFLNKSETETIKRNIIQEDSAVINVVEKTTPAVVSIIVTKDVPKMRSFFSDPFGFPDFFGNSGENSNETQKQKIGGGSGFIVSNDGMIVTNKHVVSDSGAEYTVITNDGQEHPAKILAQDPTNDIAIIKIEGSGYPTLDFGNSNDLKIGQTVIAIGNSLGEFSNTVSRGIISGLRRNVTAGSGFGDTEQLTNIIQTDAAINPGNSGGPLLNISGEVIGINVAMAQGAQSIGFAIPSVQIKKVVEQVGTTGKISAPFIGVRYLAVDSAIAKKNNFPFNYGALVTRGKTLTDFAVIPGSPADKAGIMENDIILEINGTKIDDKNGLADLIAQHNVGDELVLKIWHKGEVKEVKLKLEERK